jgi:hypothetical protein
MTDQMNYYALGMENHVKSTQALKCENNPNRTRFKRKEIQEKEFLNGFGLM